MTARLGLTDNIRLACQLRPTGDIAFRRLVLDETDLRVANQLHRSDASKSGEVQPIVLFFSDVAGFTSFSETLTPYNAMYILNRYFTQVGELIGRNDGYISKFVGDGLMAIFGVEGQPDAPIRSVNAAPQTLAAVDRMKPFFASMYGIDFNIRIGLHLGEAVIGSIGSPGHERLTAIGDAVNVASRVEAANKEAGTRLLISEALYDRVKDEVEMSDFIRVRLRGTINVTVPCVMPVVATLKPAARARRITSSGRAVVAKSRSSPLTPSARSRTAPPTTRVSAPSPLSASRASRVHRVGAAANLGAFHPSIPASGSFNSSRHEHAVLFVRRHVPPVAARGENIERTRPRTAAARPRSVRMDTRPLVQCSISEDSARVKSNRPRRRRTGSQTAQAAQGWSVPSAEQFLM